MHTLNVAFELQEEIGAGQQFVSLLKEINYLMHELKFKSLNKRENEILRLIAKGFTDKEIGAKLNISITTAKTHRNKVIKKLKLRNSASLAAFATECGVYFLNCYQKDSSFF